MKVTQQRSPQNHRPASAAVASLVLIFGLAGLACSKDDPTPSSPAAGTGGSNTGGARTGGTGGGSSVTGGAPGAGGTGGSSAATGGSSGATGGAGTTSSGGSAGGGATGGSNAGGSSGAGGNVDAGKETSAPDTSATEAGSIPVGAGPMMLTSPAFKEGADVPLKYRCRTENISPALTWTPGPAGTMSYAVTMFHQNSVHWVMWDIPATVTSLPEAIPRVPEPPVPAGSKQVKPNVDGSTWYGYSGPCPQSANRRYDYFVYALRVAKLPGVTTETLHRTVDTAIKANMIARGQLTGTGSR